MHLLNDLPGRNLFTHKHYGPKASTGKNLIFCGENWVYEVVDHEMDL